MAMTDEEFIAATTSPTFSCRICCKRYGKVYEPPPAQGKQKPRVAESEAMFVGRPRP